MTVILLSRVKSLPLQWGYLSLFWPLSWCRWEKPCVGLPGLTWGIGCGGGGHSWSLSSRLYPPLTLPSSAPPRLLPLTLNTTYLLKICWRLGRPSAEAQCELALGQSQHCLLMWCCKHALQHIHDTFSQWYNGVWDWAQSQQPRILAMRVMG